MGPGDPEAGDLDKAGPVDGVAAGPAKLETAEGSLPVVEPAADILKFKRGKFEVDQVRMLLDLGHVAGRREMNRVQTARPQVQGGLVDLGTVMFLHAVQVGEGFSVSSLLPVVGEPLQDHFFVHDPVLVPERPGAAPFSVELVVPVFFLEGFGDNSAPDPGGREGIEEADRGIFEVDGDGVIVQDLDIVDLLHVRRQVRLGVVAQPVQVPFGRGGVEFTPVVEQDPLAQGEDQIRLLVLSSCHSAPGRGPV